MKYNLSIVFICQFILIFLSAEAQWIQVADFGGLERDDLVAFTCNDRAFAGSGMQVGFEVTNDFYEYKANSNQWQAISSLPGSNRQYAFSFSFYHVAFVFAGIDQVGNDLKDGFSYQPLSNSWIGTTSYPGSGSRGCASGVLNNFGYAGLGRSSDHLLHNDWWQFNLDNNTWIQKASFPGNARNLATCFENNDFIYVIGGIGTNDIAYDDIWQYNTLNDEWLLMPFVLPNSIGNSAHCKVMFSGVLVGGYDGQGGFTNSAFQFDPFNSTLNSLPPIPVNGAIKGAKAFSINDALYVTCGITADNTRLKTTWKYDLINANQGNSFELNACCIYPNPTNANFSILLNNNQYEKYISYTICNYSGAIIKSAPINVAENKLTIEIDDISAGFYLVKIHKLHKILNYKLIVLN